MKFVGQWHQLAVLYAFLHLLKSSKNIVVFHWLCILFMMNDARIVVIEAGNYLLYLSYYYNCTIVYRWSLYNTLFILTCLLFSGTIGFFACFWFVNKIYSVVKVDWLKNSVKGLTPRCDSTGLPDAGFVTKAWGLIRPELKNHHLS